MAKAMKISLKEVVHLIWDGATWDDIENLAGNHRTTLQRKLKGEEYIDSKGNTRLRGGHYTTKEGYKRLLKKARENEKSKMNKKSPETAEKKKLGYHQPNIKNGGDELIGKEQQNNVLLVDTSYLFKIMSEGKSLYDLMSEYKILYIPQRIMDELNKAARDNCRPNRKAMAKKLLDEIASKSFDEKSFIIDKENCTELFVDNVQSDVEIRDRTKAVVAALCWLFSENKHLRITCLTSTRQIAWLACKQGLPQTVEICYEEAVRLD